MIGKILSVAAFSVLALPALAQQLAPAKQFTPAKKGFYNGDGVGSIHALKGLDAFGTGQYAGYQFNSYLNAELSFLRLPETYVTSQQGPALNGMAADKNVRTEKTSFALTAKFPVSEKVDVFSHASYKHIVYKTDAGMRTTANEASAGVGAIYSVNPKVELRVEKQHVKNRPTILDVAAGFKF